LINKTYLLLFASLLMSTHSLAQKEWSVYGKVINEKSERPVPSLTVTNIRTKRIVVTNDTGDFYIRAAEGDSLRVSGVGYGDRTVFWDKKTANLVIGLEQIAISLEEIVVKDKRSETLEKEIKAFLENPVNAATLKQDIMGNMIQTSGAGGLGGGAGISIDALYDLWSKDGKNRRKAVEMEYQDLKRFYINLRYNQQKVSNLTGLKEPEILEFMDFCKLQDDFILNASDYDLTYRIFSCLRSFNASSQFPVIRKKMDIRP
jgi:hypothetical protein